MAHKLTEADESNLANWFTHHPPTNDQKADYVSIRDAAKAYAKVIMECTPSCADQTAALRKLRESVMIANSAIACNGK